MKGNGLAILHNCLNLVFTEIGSPSLVVEEVNFTTSMTNTRFFKRNALNISVGILGLKILDLIFRQMTFIDHVPLPSNREFIMKPSTLATLTQMLVLQNTDLTREVLIFIETHLNNHFAFF